MKNVLFLCTSLFAVGCVTSSDGAGDEQRDPQVSYADEEEVIEADAPPVLLDVRATESPARIHEFALTASLTACHGTTYCTGGVLISGYYTVNCGAPYCSSQSCAKSDIWTVKKQPREMYRAYAMPDGSVCLAYQPALAANAGCSCSEL
jgi:hypothetical protein